MFLNDVKSVITQKNIVCVSPHYDDFLFFLGGYVLEMKRNGLLETKKYTNINTFSRTNYQERDIQGNKDRSLKRVQYATGIRFIEDLQCLDALLGARAYTYRAMGEEESQVRGKSFQEGKGEMEMAYGSYESMDSCDWEILGRMQACIRELAMLQDTAVILPLAMKGHIDHFIVREAGIRALEELDGKTSAAIYFAEDKPYAGLLNEDEMKLTTEFIRKYNLSDIAYRHHPQEVIDLAFEHYPSQVDEVYHTGINARGKQLQEYYGVEGNCDRIFKFSHF